MIDNIINRLEGVRETAPGRYVARCPAHEDRSPSLAVTEADGKVLIHCFGGCHVFDIVAAIGLELSDLFPPRVSTGKPVKKRLDYRGAWILARRSFHVLNLATSDIENGRSLSEQDRQTVAEARRNINAILEYLGQ